MEINSVNQMGTDALHAVAAAAFNNGIVVVSAIAEQVRLRHSNENVAREDIEALVVQFGTLLGAIMEISTFDGTAWGPELACDQPSRISVGGH